MTCSSVSSSRPSVCSSLLASVLASTISGVADEGTSYVIGREKPRATLISAVWEQLKSASEKHSRQTELGQSSPVQGVTGLSRVE